MADINMESSIFTVLSFNNCTPSAVEYFSFSMIVDRYSSTESFSLISALSISGILFGIFSLALSYSFSPNSFNSVIFASFVFVYLIIKSFKVWASTPLIIFE